MSRSVSRVLYSAVIYLGRALPQRLGATSAGQPSRHDVPPRCCFGQGLHNDGVSPALVSSYLAFPPLRRQKNDSRLFSVALSLGSPPAAVSRCPCSVKPGLSSDRAFRRSDRDCLIYSRSIILVERGFVKSVILRSFFGLQQAALRARWAKLRR